MITIGVAIKPDYENNNPDWDWTAWDKKVAEVRKQYGFVYETDDEIVTTNGRVVEELKKFATTAPGWEDKCAPQYAPNPILFQTCDTDEYLENFGKTTNYNRQSMPRL